MAIAGVKPVGYATSELGSLEYAKTSITDNAMLPISLTSGTELYTTEQVEEILLKAAEFWIDEYDYYNDQFTTVDYDLEVYDFMKSREEE